MAMCGLRVSRQGYYRRRRTASQREVKDQPLAQTIRRLHIDSGGRYGVRRLVAQCRAEGWHVGLRHIRRLMQTAGLQGLQHRRHVVTTRASHRPHGIPDRIQRHFVVSRPDELWVADATYLPTRQGMVYLAIVLDACTRRVVGWSMARRQTRLKPNSYPASTCVQPT